MIRNKLLLSASISTIAWVFASQAVAQPAPQLDDNKAPHIKLSPEQKDKYMKMHMDKMWKEVDTDKDGKLSRQEALAKASQEFDKKDLNHDGFLTKDEIHQAHQEMAKKHGEHLRKPPPPNN